MEEKILKEEKKKLQWEEDRFGSQEFRFLRVWSLQLFLEDFFSFFFSVHQVMGRYLNANPPPLLALYRGVDLLDLGDRNLIQIQGLTNSVHTLIVTITARLSNEDV